MSEVVLYWRGAKAATGESIADAWGRYMERHGFRLVGNSKQADVAVFLSDAVVEPALSHRLPTIGFFWGWPPQRLLDPDFRAHAARQVAALSRCHVVVAPSLISQYQLATLGLASICCAPGVDIEAAAAAAALGTPPTLKKEQFIYVGRLAPHKLVEWAIRGFAKASEAGLIGQTRLLIFGEGERESRLRELVAGLGLGANVFFAKDEGDTQDDSWRWSEIKSSLALIQPSTYEGFSMTPLEALAVGTLPIVSDIPQHRWLLKGHGRYFSGPEELAEQLGNAFSAREDGNAEGEQMVKAAYSLDAASNRLSQVIRHAVTVWMGQAVSRSPKDRMDAYDLEYRCRAVAMAEGARRYAVQSPDDPDPSVGYWRFPVAESGLRALAARSALDAGCGPGDAASFLRERGYTIAGLDFSLEALHQAEGKIEDRVLGDVNQLPFGDKTFDAVLLGEVLEHVPSPSALLSEALRVSRLGVVITTPIGHHHDAPAHLQHFGAEWELEQLLRGRLGLFEERFGQVSISRHGAPGTEESVFLVVARKGSDMGSGVEG